ASYPPETSREGKTKEDDSYILGDKTLPSRVGWSAESVARRVRDAYSPNGSFTLFVALLQSHTEHPDETHPNPIPFSADLARGLVACTQSDEILRGYAKYSDYAW